MTRFVFLLVPVWMGCSSLPHSGPVARQGSYTVPVKEELKKYSKFDLDEVVIEQKANQLTLRYTLPRELTGRPQLVEFKGMITTEGPMTLTGKNGTMACKSSVDLSSCEVRYKDLEFDLKARDQALKESSSSAEELKGREAVAVAFHAGGEPHGVLHVYKYRLDQPSGYNPQ